MPHINRIRVNNVKYNFGTQFYDDFVMRFDGKNALYDLANGEMCIRDRRKGDPSDGR